MNVQARGLRSGLPVISPQQASPNVNLSPVVTGSIPGVTLAWPSRFPAVAPAPVKPMYDRGRVRTALGKAPRWALGKWGRTRPAVASQTPQTEALSSRLQGAVSPGIGTVGANVYSPLFGRPGFSYTYAQPARRIGPAPKLSPGTGQTGGGSNRSLGFQPAGYASQQHMPMQQFDYTPPTDATFDVGNANAFQGGDKRAMPRSIGVGTDGRSLVGTYTPHDFTPADRFFKQGRASANWQDMSFGPDYRFLLPYQQVARYNLYNQIAPARPLSPNAYFLGYQTQAGVASQIGGVTGMGRPLGY